MFVCLCGDCQLLIESYSSSGPYSIRTAVKAAFIQLLSLFVNKLSSVSGRLVSGLCLQFYRYSNLFFNRSKVPNPRSSLVIVNVAARVYRQQNVAPTCLQVLTVELANKG